MTGRSGPSPSLRVIPRAAAGLALVLGPILGLGLAGCGGTDSSDTTEPSSSSPTSHLPSAKATFQLTGSDFIELRRLLAARATAVLHHDEPTFLATVDRGDDSLVTQQRSMYRNMIQLPLASLRYTMDTSSLLVPAQLSGNDPVLRPLLVEHARITGTMTAPVSNEVDETFVRRNGHWLVGADVKPGVDDSVETAQERPWYGVPIVARTDGRLTVMVDRSRSSSLGTLLHEVSDDIDVDASLLGVPARHAILVDATSNGASLSFNSLSKEQAGAVTFGLAHTNATGDQYLGLAGLAIKINPHDVGQLATSTPLLRHELTHFLLHEYSGTSPKWLSEGIANWVEFYPDDYPALRLTGDLYGRVMSADRELPTLGIFNYTPDVNYQIAQAAVAWLVSHYGMPRLLSLMKAYRADYQGVNVDALTPRLLRRVYGLSQQQVVSGAFALIASFQH
jgi:hypothetical protein